MRVLVLLSCLWMWTRSQSLEQHSWMEQEDLSTGLCRHGNSVECCLGWRQTDRRRCQPLCQEGCKHGQCVGADRCRCHPGYTGKTCNQDVNECGLKPRPCKHRCMNTPGSFKCFCPNGYTLQADGSCRSVRTCFHANCQYGCEVLKGSVRCTCPSPGLRLGPDRRSCVDIDECVWRRGACPRRRKCVNTFGSFLCRCHLRFKLTYVNGRYSCIDKDTRPFCSLNPSSPKCSCKDGSCQVVLKADVEPPRPRTPPGPAYTSTVTTATVTSVAHWTTKFTTVPVTTVVPMTTSISMTTTAPTATTVPMTTSVPMTTTAPTATTVPMTTSVPMTTTASTATTVPMTTSVPMTTTASTATTVPMTTSIPMTTTASTATTVPMTTTVPMMTTVPTTAAVPVTTTVSMTTVTATTLMVPTAVAMTTTSSSTTSDPSTTPVSTATAFTTTVSSTVTTMMVSNAVGVTTATRKTPATSKETTTMNNKINKHMTQRQRGDVHIPRRPSLNQVWEFDVELGNTAEDVKDDPELGALSCSFDLGLCDWTSDRDGDVRWETVDGPTGGRYLSVPELKAGQRSIRGARLVVQVAPPWSRGQLCFSFSHWLTGRQVGVLQLFVRRTGGDGRYGSALWSRTGGHGWRRTEVTVATHSVDRVLLKAERRIGRYGQIAIDDVTLRRGPC